MAKAFLRIPPQKKEKLQKQIPLKILKRLKSINEKIVFVKQKSSESER